MVKDKNIKTLETEAEKFKNTGYQHYGFFVENYNGFLCISQKCEGKRKQKIVLQYSQIDNLISCIESVKEDYNKFNQIQQKISVLMDKNVEKK